MTGVNGILTHSFPVYLGVSSSTGDFTGSVTPSSVSVSSASGGSANYTVTLSPVNGGAGDVVESATGLPPGATATFAPSTTIPGSNGSATLNIAVPSGTPQGTYQIFITSQAAGVVHQGSVSLVVTP